MAIKSILPHQAFEECTDLDEYSYELYKEVYELADKAHQGQLRDDGTDYFNHPRRVSEMALDKTKSMEAVIIALLHDVIEDTDTTVETLVSIVGKTITKKVLLLTKKPGQSTTGYLKNVMLYADRTTLIIKILDRIDNVSDLKNNPDKEKVEKYSQITINSFIPMLKMSKHLDNYGDVHMLIIELRKKIYKELGKWIQCV